MAGKCLSPISLEVELKKFYSKDELFTRYNLDQDIIKAVTEKYDIASWVNLNQSVPIDLNLWVGLDEWQRKYGINRFLKEAIKAQVNKIVEERNNQARESQRKYEMEKAQMNQIFQGHKINMDKFFK